MDKELVELYKSRRLVWKNPLLYSFLLQIKLYKFALNLVHLNRFLHVFLEDFTIYD